MGRRSSTSFKKTNTNLPRKTTIPKNNFPTTSQSQSKTTSSLGESVKQGVGLGIGMGLGSSLANIAVDKLTSNDSDTNACKNNNINTQTNFDNCKHILEIYNSCLKEEQSEKCSFFLKNYDKCRNGLL